MTESATGAVAEKPVTTEEPGPTNATGPTGDAGPVGETAAPEYVEQVLVVPTALFHEVGLFQGCNTDVNRYLDKLLDRSVGSYRPRPEMEKDPSFKQLIPYVIFRLVDEGKPTLYFAYTRTKKQGEQRLHGKRSIGVGGHVSDHDGEHQPPYEIGLTRELSEEVTVDCRHDVQAPAALINDDANEVGKVHLGIVHFADLKPPTGRLVNADFPLIKPRDPEEMVEAGLHPAQWFFEHLQEFEPWSQIAIQSLLGNGSSTSTLTQP